MSRVPPGADPSALSVAPRRSLLDALEALDVHRAAVTVVGAQGSICHDPMIVSSLEPAQDSRAISVNVAGVAALLVAKTHKIGDRLENARTGQRDRFADKDAGDVVRLMTTSSARQVGMTLHGLKDHPVADEATRTSLALLPAQFGTRAAPGVEMAVRALAGGTRGEDGIRDLCVAYTRTLVRTAEAGSAVEPPS